MTAPDRAALFERVLAPEPGRTALLVVDMQRGFLDPGEAMEVTGAFNREYRVTVVEDGVATLWPEVQRTTLDIVARAYGRVVSSRQVVDTVSAWR